MSWKTLVVLAVLVAGLGGFLLVDNQWLAPKREKAESAKGRLWTGDSKDVESVAIGRKDETIKLKRAGDSWGMVEPAKTQGGGSGGDAGVAPPPPGRGGWGAGGHPDQAGRLRAGAPRRHRHPRRERTGQAPHPPRGRKESHGSVGLRARGEQARRGRPG